METLESQSRSIRRIIISLNAYIADSCPAVRWSKGRNLNSNEIPFVKLDLNDSHSYRSTPLRVADKSDIQICGDLSGSATRGSKKGGIGRSGNIIDRSTRRLESAGQQRTMQQAKSVIKDQPPGLVWLHIGSTDFVLNTSWDWATSACPSASGVNKRAMMKMLNKILRLTG